MKDHHLGTLNAVAIAAIVAFPSVTLAQAAATAPGIVTSVARVR